MKAKPRLVLKKSIRNFISRCLITIIIFLTCLITIKLNKNFKNFLLKNVYQDSIEFTTYEKLYQKYFCKLLKTTPISNKEKEVFTEKINYKSIHTYHDGASLTVSNNYLVPFLESGIVVFMGEKDSYGNVVIVEGINGVDTWYGNITAKNIKMYDYVEKGSLLGETKGTKLYLVFQKKDKFLDYKDYI